MLHHLQSLFPVRYTVFGLSVLGFLLGLFALVAFGEGGSWVLVCGALSAIGLYDVLQNKHSIARNYPILGHLRHLLEHLRPQMRSYFLDGDLEAVPFSRAQRALVYERAKNGADKHSFGTQHNVYAEGYEWLNHAMAPTQLDSHDFRITLGETRNQPYSASIFNISAMSFGALSAHAILALNAGARRGGFAHNTGEVCHFQIPLATRR